MANDIGLKVLEGVSNGLTAFALPSKRNIGIIGERERGPSNTPLLVTTLAEDRTKLGKFNNAMFGPVVMRNLFKNAQRSTNVYFVRVVGAASSSAFTTVNISGTPINISFRAGQNGKEDKGNWGNDLYVSFYAFNTKASDQWAIDIFYKGRLVESWSATTCAELESQINQNSLYITTSFDAEPNTAVCNQSGTGDITTITPATSETLATAKFLVDVAGNAGNILTVLVGNSTILGTYSVGLGDSPTDVAVGIVNSITSSTHGYSAINTGAEVTITGPTSSGAALNGINLTFNYVGTVHTTETTPGDNTFTGGISSAPTQLSATVTGLSTLFTTQLAPGAVLFTAEGDMIGIVSSITSDTELILAQISKEAMNVQAFKFSPFYQLDGQLSGGIYIAPAEAEFYPVSDPIEPTGLACFDGVDVQIIATTEYNTLSMALVGRDYCADRKDAIFVANLPFSPSEQIVRSYSNQLQNANTSFIAGYNCWVKTSDDNGGYVWVPSTGCVLGAGFVRVPSQQGDFIHIPPAGHGSAFVDVVDILPRLVTQEVLNRYTRDYTVNSVVYQERLGFFIMTSRTYSTNPLYHSIHIRLQTSYYIRALQNNLGWALQRPNTPELKKSLQIACRTFFLTEYANGALERSVKFEEACVIICDQTNNPASQDRKELNMDIDWIPTEVAEAIKISLNRNDGILLIRALGTN